jgi:cytochrome oxidase Cu insertion factor (SCO1/SenC/PrrC family)
MTTNHDEALPSEPRLSEAERAAAFTKHQPVDRAAAFRAGRAPVPMKFIMWMTVVFVVLGLGGALVEHYFGGIGVTTTPTSVFKLPATPKSPSGPEITASLPALMGLKYIAHASAPSFTLTNQYDKPWGLRDARGHVVVLTFENSTCNDICPVLGAEIRLAQQRLGANSSTVDFVIINSDPKHLAVSARPPALVRPGLAALPHVFFLTSTLVRLNSVWSNYGVSVRVGTTANQVTHNDVMYFIGTKGQLAALATPFANENTQGVFSLRPIDIAHFAQGISNTASSLVK